MIPDKLNSRELKKICTLTKPPNPQDPYLDSIRHKRIISCFQRGDPACYTLNTWGEVDFYILISLEDYFNEKIENTEAFRLNVIRNSKLELEIYYEHQLKRVCSFDLNNPLDTHVLHWIAENKKVNFYYINMLEGDFVCSGIKIVYLPCILCFDITRTLKGKMPLLLPRFRESLISDKNFTDIALLKKAWVFYIDYTSVLDMMKDKNDCEEIIIRHVFHGLAQIQRSRRSYLEKNWYFIWIGRKIHLNQGKEPRDYYAVYLSGSHLSKKDKGYFVQTMEKALKELPQFAKTGWVCPLAEEGVPFVAVCQKELYRIELTEFFFDKCRRLFQKHFLPNPEYTSYYHKIMKSKKALQFPARVYSLLEKRLEKSTSFTKSHEATEFLKMIRKGNAESLPLFFSRLSLIGPQDMDEILISSCEKYGKSLEPYLLECLQSPHPTVRSFGILGLGIIESKKAVPHLVDMVKRGRQDATLAKYALVLIGGNAVNYLVPLLSDKKVGIRMKSMEILGLLGNSKAIEAIKQMKKDRSVKVEMIKKRILHKK